MIISPKEVLDKEKITSEKWPCINASIDFFGTLSEEGTKKRDQFAQELYDLFELLQEGCNILDSGEKALCGQSGIAADIILRIDLAKKEILLDRLFKYCNLQIHLFTALLEILQRNFSRFDFVVPSLQGYELAMEISRYLGIPKIECIYLKGDTIEQLFMGIPLQEITYESILLDTKRHYERRGGVEKKGQILGSGKEISMYHQGSAGEEEILWMQVRIPVSGSINQLLK